MIRYFQRKYREIYQQKYHVDFFLLFIYVYSHIFAFT